MIIVQMAGFKLIGLKLLEKTTNENGQSGIDCGNLWQEFESHSVIDRIPDKLEHKVYAVYFDYEGDEHKPFSYFIGCKVDRETSTPEGLDDLVIPEQNYMIINAKGVMPGCIADAWRDIWKSKVQRAFGYDFEIYDERSKDWSDAEVDIYVSSNSSQV
ncbi:GyrI-like domain-containing protein [Desertivirga brevis]|uniref:GyrI-like domain-containing protein n=1 Tax=Desertivirga brevis TaxID=2810310 RepID=UPI001A966F2E|nr:GyrI-like domain-containing protein [Pedobacter sp. SYSU D00873]